MRCIIFCILFCALGFGAGYGARFFTQLKSNLQSLQKMEGGQKGAVSPQGGTPVGTSTTDRADAVVDQPISIPESRLTDGQKKLLSVLGIDPAKFTVTPQMIECAETTLGAPRISEIMNGATPSPLEVIRLTPCLK